MESLDELFWSLLVDDDPKPLAQAIENGRDLSDLSSEQLGILTRLVRGKSARKPGQSFHDFQRQDANHTLCALVAFCHGATGYPIYGAVRPDRGQTCCDKFAEDFDMSPDTVAGIWKKEARSRDLSKYIEAGKQCRRRSAQD